MEVPTIEQMREDYRLRKMRPDQLQKYLELGIITQEEHDDIQACRDSPIPLSEYKAFYERVMLALAEPEAPAIPDMPPDIVPEPAPEGGEPNAESV